ncbi:hypothetical protein EVAR_8339_1 [Eumeta japonica]|uniref:Uncharacterized protein n=1 Tax=Eumeta variegata TaxID=151549 RepID=A0A4C1VCJ9_EUMVA|nr:hypothetical protein EVAR_8339_1 [Eumeta japonica]
MIAAFEDYEIRSRQSKFYQLLKTLRKSVDVSARAHVICYIVALSVISQDGGHLRAHAARARAPCRCTIYPPNFLGTGSGQRESHGESSRRPAVVALQSLVPLASRVSL